MRYLKFVLPAILLVFSTSALSTAVYSDNLALGKSVIGSTYYSSGTEVFEFDNVVDGSTSDGGSPSDWNFWLTPEGQTGYVQIDLGQEFNIGKIDFLNTHNRQYFDRSTRDWTITIFDSNLDSVFSSSGSEQQLFTGLFTELDLSTSILGQYVMFSVDSYWGRSGGLNELRVFESTDPVPSTVPVPAAAWLFGSALLGFFGFSRRKANA